MGPGGSVKVRVTFPVSVSFCLLPAVQSIVLDVPLLPLSTSALYAATRISVRSVFSRTRPAPLVPISFQVASEPELSTQIQSRLVDVFSQSDPG